MGLLNMFSRKISMSYKEREAPEKASKIQSNLAYFEPQFPHGQIAKAIPTESRALAAFNKL